MSAYQLQRRRDQGIVIRQGKSWILLKRSEVESLVRDLNNHIDDPIRVEEIDGLQKANHR
ncbi:hypothetical protein [Mycolicibacterium agri]|uniref:hypothetical protein n=1 Tax=Mycolicibacterium agri TaxID=36811 RepID=UPI0010561C4D|nr:hypothetical protein [Mycolicibacterium agri]